MLGSASPLYQEYMVSVDEPIAFARPCIPPWDRPHFDRTNASRRRPG